MLREIRVYLSVLRTRIVSVSHFRANVLAWILYSPLQVAVIYLLWTVVYRNTGRVGEYGFRDMVLYYLVVHFLGRAMGSLQATNYEVWTEINKGKLDIYLARPIRFGPFLFFRSLGDPTVEIALGLPFFLLFSALLSLPIQSDPWVLAAFFTSGFLGAVILFLIQFIVGSLTFWMERIFSIRDIVASLFLLFSGQLIPISVLPRWVAALSRALPFESVFFVPATIYARPAVDAGVAALMAQQGIWILLLLAAASVLWSRGLARYASQGG